MAKSKRLKGAAYWKLQDLLTEGEKKIKEYGEWARKECRARDLIPDVTDFVQGVIWNIAESEVSEDNPRKQVQLIKDEDVIAEALKRQAEVDEINRKLAFIVKSVAKAAGVRADQVNPRTGLISLEAPEDVEEFECDLPDEEEK